MLRIENLKVYSDLNKEEVIERALKKNGISENDVLFCAIVRKSIDARNKKDVHYNYALDVEVKNENKYPKLKRVEKKKEIIAERNRKSLYRPVIVGSGPAGLFCALILAENGYQPIILERGDCVENRRRYVEEYRKNGILNEMCNVQFGEGGAGTFSDGKLTTGISSPYVHKVLELFYQFGAPEEITYLAHPHIGTDNLLKILVNIRQYIEEKGGTYYFNTCFRDVEEKNGVLEIRCDNLTLESDCLVLAIGHSARDTFQMLQKKQMDMKQKNFAVGVRIEHKQADINKAQYGEVTKLKLPSAEYKLVYQDKESGRACYTFCMCPGGEVIASSSEEGHIVTNGMSNFKRDSENANSGLLVNVTTADLHSDDPLAGMYYQEELEKKAFVLGGGNHHAPVQRLEDFVAKRKSTEIGHIKPSYLPGYTLSDLNEILPDYVSETLKKGIAAFDHKLKGFADPDAILTGVETRTSSPVTLTRNEKLMSSIKGIYPCGEGAGYAGGITSAAVDGIKVALQIMSEN